MAKIYIILIIFLGLVVYANSLNGEFIWDDDSFIEENLYIRSWSSIGRFFAGDPGYDAAGYG